MEILEKENDVGEVIGRDEGSKRNSPYHKLGERVKRPKVDQKKTV